MNSSLGMPAGLCIHKFPRTLLVCMGYHAWFVSFWSLHGLSCVKLISTHSVRPARGRANYGTKWGHSARPPTYSLLPSLEQWNKTHLQITYGWIKMHDFTKYFLNFHPCFTKHIIENFCKIQVGITILNHLQKGFNSIVVLLLSTCYARWVVTYLHSLLLIWWTVFGEG